MNFFDAMQLMKLGKRVRLKSWQEGCFIGVEEEKRKIFGKEKIVYSPLTESLTPFSSPVSFSALLKNEWEEFQDDSDE